MSTVETIPFIGYLVIEAVRTPYKQWKTGGRLTVKKPSLGRGEVAVRIQVDLPVSLFERPQLEARITVPEGCAAPVKIDLEAAGNIEDLIRANTGFDVKLIPVEGGGK